MTIKILGPSHKESETLKEEHIQNYYRPSGASFFVLLAVRTTMKLNCEIIMINQDERCNKQVDIIFLFLKGLATSLPQVKSCGFVVKVLN